MRAIKLCLWLLMLVIALPASALEFRFGEYQLSDQGIADCIGIGAAKSCEIKFDQPFSTKPLVFLMPTIEEGDGRDAPSTLRLINVTKTGATFRQYIAPMRSGIELKSVGNICSPNTKSNYCLETVPMDKVRYFAIEPGTLNFGDKGRIQAGTVEISRYLVGGNGVNNNNLQDVSSPVNYNAAFNNPGVLLSLQGNGQTDIGSQQRWVTPVVTAVQQDLNRVFVALDRSELASGGHYGGEAQEVAYIVAEGQGSHKGLQFAMGAGATLNTLVNGLKQFDQVTEPTLRQCAATTSVPSGFSSEPFIIASKNSRKGNNGGWIRLCRLGPSGSDGYNVSFVNDEDLNEGKLNSVERKHLSEDIGYMAFQRKASEATCEVFPGPAQTWTDRSNYQAKLHHLALINGTYQENGGHYLWFNTTSNGTSTACDGQACLYPTNAQPDKWATEVELGDFVVTDQNAPDYGQDNTLEEYGTFYMGNATDKVEELRNGAGERIRLLELNNGAALHLYEGTYWFEEIRINSASHIVTHGNVIVHTKNLNLADFSTMGPQSGEPDSLQLYAHEGKNIEDTNVYLSKGSSITGLVYSQSEVTLAGGDCKSDNDCEVTSITGAVTAARLEMNSSKYIPTAVINGNSSCFDTTPDFTLDITPDWQQNMLCESQEVLFSLAPDDAGGDTFDGGITVSITAKSGQSASGVWSTSALEGSNYGQPFQDGVPFTVPVSALDNNQKQLWFKSDYLGELELTATIDGLSGNPPVGRYQFLPGGFVITPNPLRLVAGRPAEITVKAMACDTGDSVISEYSGNKTLDIKTKYDKPATSNSRNDKVVLQNTAGTDIKTWQGSQGQFAFVDGVASGIPVKYDDAGEMTLTLSDPKCTKDSCDLASIGGESSQIKQLPTGWQGLTGSVLVQSRPYTFALCNAGAHAVELATGTAYNGDAFISAGEVFQTKVKPVIWFESDNANNDIDDSGNATAMVDSRNLCQRAITPNFYASDAPKATVALSIPSGEGIKPHSPTEDGAISGNLSSTPLSNEAVQSNDFSASWDEVGSIQLQASTLGDYLGMTMNMGYRPVGRFYPDSFTIVSVESGKKYPDSQSFVYMNQPFTAQFKVEAQNAAGEPTQNYGHFAPPKQVAIEIAAIDTNVERGKVNDLGGRIDWGGLPSSWNKNWNNAHITVDWFTLAFKRDVKSAASQDKAVTTEPDGPYDVALGIMRESMGVNEANSIGYPGIEVDHELFPCDLSKDGCTDADSRGVMEFATFNTRYGRMALDGASGRFDSELSIPLRVEYWDSPLTDWVRNTQDSRAAFNGQLACKQIISQSDTAVTSASYTQGSGHVESGDIRSGEFVAVPTNAKDDDGNPLIYREQVRFWQKVISDKPKAIDNEPEIRCEGGPSSDHSNYQPWLTFDWRGKGDESPHSTVTFGAFRGNDRVLYRGEKGINTMLD
ncbi:DUF6701 domain-containing protein [Photobacterium sp. DNB23_23_1]